MADLNNSSSDESTDASNSQFDSLKALYSSKYKIPIPEAPIYDNINKYDSVLNENLHKNNNSNKKTSKDAAVKSVPTRRFLPHQQPVECKRPVHRINSNRNVLAKMENIDGPLQLLFNCMQMKTKIKVLTRNARGIRGYIEAYVAAFDKHWNLALEDCTEVWTRKIKRKAPALGIAAKFKAIEEDTPKVIVKECNEKTETLERHVPQILLRGEQVAVIIKVN